MNGPKTRLVRSRNAWHLFKRITFPTRTAVERAKQLRESFDTHKRVQQPSIPKIDFGGFDLALARVFIPGLQLANHESLRQEVQIPANGCLADDG